MNVFWSAAPAGAINKERTIPRFLMSKLSRVNFSYSLVIRAQQPLVWRANHPRAVASGLLQEALYGQLTDAIEPIPPSDLTDDYIPRPIDKVGGGQAKHPIDSCG
jgi:hypothetical protein